MDPTNPYISAFFICILLEQCQKLNYVSSNYFKNFSIQILVSFLLEKERNTFIKNFF